MKYLAFILLLASLLPAQENERVRLDRIATGITQCTDIQSARDGSGRMSQPVDIDETHHSSIINQFFNAVGPVHDSRC